MKGEKCDFLHQYDPSRMPECVFWLKFGKCSDPECVFRHVAPSERPECQRYRLGFCRYGPLCRSRHDRMPRDALPEVLPDWFLDSLILNSNLIPRADEVRLTESGPTRRDGMRSGTQIPGLELALVAAPATEQGTIPGLLPPIHGKCRYFIMRSMYVRNIQISAAKGIWATSLGNSQRLRQAFNDVNHIILIFSATESRNFQGYGKMLCEPDDLLFPGIWGDLSCRLSANFRVHWIKQCTVPLSHADHIKNPQNEDLPVRRCRDGQELPSSVGERLCRFLWQQPFTDLLKGTDLEFEPRVSYDPPTRTPQENDVGNGGIPEREVKTDAAVPLALEDKKDAVPEPDDRSRPAPVALGTFQKEPRESKAWLTDPHPVTVGKALASGSSSLLAAVNEEATRFGRAPTGSWMPPPGWRPMPPAGYMGGPPGFPPFPGYPPYMPGRSGYLASGACPPGVTGYGEARPPGYWGDRVHAQPNFLEGTGVTGSAGGTRERARSRPRSRSRGRQRRKRGY